MFKIEAGEDLDNDLVPSRYITIRLSKAKLAELEAIHGPQESQRMVKDEIIKFMNDDFVKYVEEKKVQE